MNNLRVRDQSRDTSKMSYQNPKKPAERSLSRDGTPKLGQMCFSRSDHCSNVSHHSGTPRSRYSRTVKRTTDLTKKEQIT